MNEKMRWLRKIHAYDFALVELQLYLDTHPDDMDALKARKMYTARRKQMVTEYETRFGKYIVTADDVGNDYWDWVKDPWPWDYVKAE